MGTLFDQPTRDTDHHAEQEYHRGNLARDRQHDSTLNSLAVQLYRRALRGEIHLLQRRIAENKFTYFFVDAAA